MQGTDVHTVVDAVRFATARFGERDAVLDAALDGEPGGKPVRGPGVEQGTGPGVEPGTGRAAYGDLAGDVRRVAAALVGHGVLPGDRVCIWAPNSLQWMLAALGAQYIGAVLVPLNTRYRGHEAADVLRRTGARLLLTGQGFLGTDHVGMLRQAADDASEPSGEPFGDPLGNPPGRLADGPHDGPIPGLPRLRTVVTLSGQSPGCLSWQRFLDVGAGVDPARVEALADGVRPDDVADILFTSGTTGRSKGAMSSHRQTTGVARDWAHRARLSAEDRYLIVNPFFHSFGSKAGYLACLLHGALAVPMPVFDATRTLDLVERERITVLPGPPTIYQAMLEDPSLPARDLSSLRLAVTGAAMVPQTLVARMNRDLGFDTTLTAYGLTEAVVVTMCTEEDDARTVATTCGRPVDGVEVRTTDAQGLPTPPGVPGEVLVRGPHVMLGYLDDPAATAAAVDADGWLHTGDIGVLDERGYLKITDRIKDVFTVGGFNVYPAELEQVLCAHPAVRDCAVIGVPDDRLGEVGRAYVCARAGTRLDPDDLLAYCRERLANFKVPRTVVVVEELPRNAGGKVLKRELRERAVTGD